MKQTVNIRVYYGDTDADGIVYNPNYLDFAERGRTEFLREVGFENSQLKRDEGIIFVIRRAEVDYLNTAHLDDMLQLETAIVEIKNTSFIMNQRLFRDGNMIADMRIVLVCVDAKTYKPLRLPKNIKDAFQPFKENV